MNARFATIHRELKKLKELSLVSLAKELKTNAFLLGVKELWSKGVKTLAFLPISSPRGGREGAGLPGRSDRASLRWMATFRRTDAVLYRLLGDVTWSFLHRLIPNSRKF